VDVSEIAVDLRAEQEALDSIVAPLADTDWDLMTPSPRWRIRDQIAHLAFFDETATLAIDDPDAFQIHVGELVPLLAEGDGAVDGATIGTMENLSSADLLSRWRTARTTLARASGGLTNENRIAWYGPAMGATSFLTARLMETWAHGQDIVDALGRPRRATDRLRHIANLGLRTRGWSYLNRGQTPPPFEVRLELFGPSGDTWRLGPDEAAESVIGSAEEFCLVVTQRRHIDDTGVIASPGARDWLEIAQAFAGPPTLGPEKGTRP